MKAIEDVSEAAAASALATELRLVIGKLNRRLRAQAATGNLTQSQKSVLVHLDREGSASVTSLARAEGVRPQSMGATVAALQAAGMIRAVPHASDGRQTVLSLTPSCQRMIKAGRMARQDWLFRNITAQLDSRERKKLAAGVALLKRLVED
jgi:DNA-binding MarR family transcriptional regulator